MSGRSRSRSRAPRAAVDITNPNSRVDIYGVRGRPRARSAASPRGTASTGFLRARRAARIQLIQQNVRVLKPATATPVTIGNQSVSGSTLVLIVARSHVQQLLDDQQNGIYLVLRPGKSGALPVTPVIPGATAATTTGAS